MNLGSAFLEIRASRGWTQKELEKKLGAHRQAISQIETGLRGTSHSLVEKLCKVAKIKVSYFYILADEQADEWMKQKVRESIK